MNKREKAVRIIVTGGSGFIGSNFLNYVSDPKRKKYNTLAPSRKEFDLLNIIQLRKVTEEFKPEVIINFAAFRNANEAELQRGDKRGIVWMTNVTGVKNISKIAKESNAFLIHISTDMVFSGSTSTPGPYKESDKPEEKMRKLSWYGWTKAEGERVLAGNKRSAIVRIGNVTKPVYDPSLDYVGKILYLYDKNKLYPLFHNQFLTLTTIPSLFEAIEKIIAQKKTGVFHVASSNVFTPYKLGEYLLKKARGKKGAIKKIDIDEYLRKIPNRYPKYGGLLAKKTAMKLKIKFDDWRKAADLFAGSIFKK